MKKRILSILLCLTMAVGLLPTTAFALNQTGNGTENAPYVYEVSSAEDVSTAVNEINANTSDSAYYTISLLNDIEIPDMSFTYNTTTILGNGHTLTAYQIAIGKNTASNPVLILGNSDGTDTLILQGRKTNDNPPFFLVGNNHIGTANDTLKMYDGVTITGSTGSSYYGGAVIVGSGGYFEMNGGTIRECGIEGGSTCFGGGVAVINGGKFTMNGGSIEDCFLKTNIEYTDAFWLEYQFGFHFGAENNLLVNSGAGAGVFVSNGAVFKMTGGEIKNNTISSKSESVKSYGVGGGIAVLAKMYSLDITARVEITGGTIEGNRATLGGGIAVCSMMPFAPDIDWYRPV